MNSEQIKRLVTWAVTGLGGAFMGWAMSRGWQWGTTVNQFLTSDFVIGLLALAATGFITWLRAKLPWIVGILDSFAKDPATPVQQIVMSPTPEGAAIAASLPGRETVVASQTSGSAGTTTKTSS